MRFVTLHKAVSYLLVFTALLALALAGEFSTFAVTGSFGALVVSWFVEPQEGGRWGPRLWAVATIGLLLYTLVDVVLGDAPTLVSAVQFLLFLVVNKLFNRRQSGDYLQLYVLSLVTLVAAAAFNTDLSFALCFLLYIVAATWSMILLHLRREMEENYLLRHTEPQAVAKRVEVQRILQSKRIVSGRFLFATSLLSLAVFFASGVLFFLFPRVGFGLMFGKSRAGLSMAGFSDRIELGQFGRIRDNPAVVLRVELPGEQTPASRLGWHWRGISFDRYDGRGWHKDFSGWKQLPRGRLARQFLWKSKVQLDGARRALVYSEPITDRNVIFSPGKALAVTLPEKRNFSVADPRYVRRDALGDLSLDGDPTAAISYTVDFKLEEPLPEVLARTTDFVPRHLRKRYLQLPPLAERVHTLAQELTRAAKTPYERTLAVLRHLRESFRYTLERTGNPALPPLEDFLFEHKEGHCEYFSTAMAILLRTVGVPTRSVNGFLGGEWNPYGRYYAVRQGDAHSWVEVYLGEAGWVRFDPTPPDPNRGVVDEGLWATIEAFVDSIRLKWFKYVVEYDLGKQVSIFKSLGQFFRDLFGGSSGQGLWAELKERLQSPLGASVAAAVVLALLALILWRRRRRGGLAARRAEGRRREITDLYLKLLGSLRLLGFDKPAAETPRAFASRLAHQRAWVAPTVQRFTQAYNDVRFGDRPLASTEVRELRALIKQLARPPAGPVPPGLAPGTP